VDRYADWAPFYDSMQGDRSEAVAYARRLMEKHHAAPRSVLELGCGTGTVLEQLPRRYRLAGVDLSKQMLAVAARKLPKARLVQHDMTTIDLGETFDVVLCLFDSINHLPAFEHWEAVFDRAHEHLDEGGIFVFDMNTQLHLSELAEDPPITQWTREGDFSMLEVVEADDGSVAVEITVFEHRRGGDYRLHSAHIPEVSFPAEQVKASLRERFRRVSVYDHQRSRPSSLSYRLHFVCTK
jgi:SAM-dependent methyltransferase